MIQNILVGLIVLAAVLFAGRAILRKRGVFSPNVGCGDDCGCGKK